MRLRAGKAVCARRMEPRRFFSPRVRGFGQVRVDGEGVPLAPQDVLLLQLIEQWHRIAPPDPVINEVIHLITISYSDVDDLNRILDAMGYRQD